MNIQAILQFLLTLVPGLSRNQRKPEPEWIPSPVGSPTFNRARARVEARYSSLGIIEKAKAKRVRRRARNLRWLSTGGFRANKTLPHKDS